MRCGRSKVDKHSSSKSREISQQARQAGKGPGARDFAMALRARKISRAFAKRAPGTKNEYHRVASLSVSHFFRRQL